MENSKSKKFIFKLQIILSSTMKLHAILLCPAWNVNQLFIKHIHSGHANCLVTLELPSLSVLVSQCLSNHYFT